VLNAPFPIIYRSPNPFCPLPSSGLVKTGAQHVETFWSFTRPREHQVVRLGSCYKFFFDEVMIVEANTADATSASPKLPSGLSMIQKEGFLTNPSFTLSLSRLRRSVGPLTPHLVCSYLLLNVIPVCGDFERCVICRTQLFSPLLYLTFLTFKVLP